MDSGWVEKSATGENSMNDSLLSSQFFNPGQLDLTQSNLNVEREIIGDLKRQFSEGDQRAQFNQIGQLSGIDIDAVIQENSRRQKKPEMLESSWQKINSFKLENVSSSELSLNVEQIYDRIKEEEDIVVPLQMARLKEEIRTEKKKKVVNAFQQVMGHKFSKNSGNQPSSGKLDVNLSKKTIIEEDDEDQADLSEKPGIKINSPVGGHDTAAEKESKVATFSQLRSKIRQINLTDSRVQSLMKKISIDATIVNSLIGSRFNTVLCNQLNPKEPEQAENKISQEPKITMLDKYREMDQSVLELIKSVFKSYPSKLRNNIDLDSLSGHPLKNFDRKMRNEDQGDLEFLKELKFTSKRDHLKNTQPSNSPHYSSKHSSEA